ncbi:MAG TPA: FdtA/QdtA family cupin domain-containing protein [Lacibacter sp.]|nr:FdtA/QdtA family cupin domain-containing protein [Lacibacter sp.]HMO90217.1 FdtA/QdtA family cupin domain-containing protein [Lacibacter sp.]HMP86271.1 FdtA/QdtA family cupin domain-containing protein [Lacibacter sp.]
MIAVRTSVHDCSLVDLPKIHNRAGNITPVNAHDDVPFDIKRIYYLYDMPGGESRGGHAHKQLKQLIVAASGSFEVVLNDGKETRRFYLNHPYYGLLVVPGIWRELVNFSSGSICLVLASEIYNEDDYLRHYQDYLDFIRTGNRH